MLIYYYNYVFPKTGTRNIVLFSTIKTRKNFKKQKNSKTFTFLQIKKHPDVNFWIEKTYAFEEKMTYGNRRLL
jgi:hypothetical protein